MILRDHLAIDRTRLANDRTLLAYLRTGLYLVMTAVAVWNLEVLRELHWVGGIAIAAGAIVMGAGVLNHWKMRRKIRTYFQKESA